MHLLLDSKQDSRLQVVMLDRVHCASRPGAVLVGRASVIHILAACAPG